MIASHILQCVGTAVFWWICRRENKLRDIVQGVPSGEVDARDIDATAFSDMTDRENLNFRYIY